MSLWKKKYKRIRKKGDYTFGDNYELIFKDEYNNWLSDCNITCGNDCEIVCGGECNITCENDCEIDCRKDCYIKAGERSQLKPYGNLLKTIIKDEEFIWWHIYGNLINTFEDVDWKNKNLDKWNEFYAFVHNELDSATLF